MKIVREEIYDENGLVRFIDHEVEEDIDELILQKEDLLLQMYNELQELKNSRSI